MQLLPAELTLQLLLMRVLALVIIVTIDGLAVAATAVALGDRGPKYDGRLTATPNTHLDIIGGAALVVFGLGWGRPMAIDPKQFRIGPVGVVVVILAATLTLLLLAFLLRSLILPVVIAPLPDAVALTTQAFLREAARLCILFALFNLLPIPPLTGGLLLSAFNITVPRQVVWALEAGLLVLIALGYVRGLLEPGFAFLRAALLGS